MSGAVAVAERRPRWATRDYSFAAPLAVLVLLLAFNLMFTPNFATRDTLTNIFTQMATTSIAAIGLTFVMACGGIDLSVGSVMGLSAALAAVLVPRSLPLALAAALLAGVAVGAMNGIMAARLTIQPIVVTLASLIAVRGLAEIVSHNGQLILISRTGFLALGRGHLLSIPSPILAMLAVAVPASLLLTKTVFGRYLLAIGGSARAAELAGVPAVRMQTTAYMISGLLAALAGLIEAARLGASDAANIGFGVELDALAATVVGGTALAGGRATIVGTLLGALILQIVTTTLNMHLVGYAWSLITRAAILVLALVVQGRRRA